MKKLSKKGQVGSIQTFVMAIVGVAVVLAVGLIVLAELNTSTDDTNATAAINTITNKLSSVPTWIGIIITVALSFIVLSFFAGRAR